MVWRIRSCAWVFNPLMWKRNWNENKIFLICYMLHFKAARIKNACYKKKPTLVVLIQVFIYIKENYFSELLIAISCSEPNVIVIVEMATWWHTGARNRLSVSSTDATRATATPDLYADISRITTCRTWIPRDPRARTAASTEATAAGITSSSATLTGESCTQGNGSQNRQHALSQITILWTLLLMFSATQCEEHIKIVEIPSGSDASFA